MIVLLSAPKAEGYYSHIGFEARSGWILPAGKSVR
jgi:hypothetical protein